MVRLLSTYLFDRPTHLVSSFMRGMSEPSERWTLPQVLGPRLASVPVFVLTSSLTISAAESFVFGLKAHDRVTIIGEPTAGGGHFGGVVSLPGGFSMFLPRGRTYDPRTNEGWEATGIQPDVRVPYERALETALEMAKNLGR
jgi:C-terminal processing protease CtpA/Prc